jgi:class 3 adenylate cyclase
VTRVGEDEAEVLRREHFDPFREVLRLNAGREVKNLGDGLMVAFTSASDGVACAVGM